MKNVLVRKSSLHQSAGRDDLKDRSPQQLLPRRAWIPRATGDIDIWVRNSPGNARKTFQALVNFGAPLSSLSEEDLTSPDMIVQIGVEPCRIDLMTGRDGVEFDQAWKNRVKVSIDDLEIDVLSRGDLLTNKLATGRDQDQGDIAWLKKNQGSNP